MFLTLQHVIKMYEIMEAITTRRQCVKSTLAVSPIKRYTMEEIDTMIGEAERQIIAGETIPDDEVWRKYDEEFSTEEKEKLELA